jgi:hypothetical protein
MKTLGKARGVGAVIAVAIGLSVVSAGVTVSAPVHAQIAPNSGQPTTPGPAQKPAAPAAKPAAPATATAPKPVDTKALLASGEKKFKAADYAGALTDFEAANAAKATPEGDRFIGQCHDNLGHFPEAVTAYERFLANVPAKMKDAGEETKKRVEAIKTMPGKVHVETIPSGAQITVDAASNPNATPQPNPTPTDLDLAPGKHTLKISYEGYASNEREVDVPYGSKQEVKLELVKNEPPPPPPPPVVAEAPAPAPTPALPPPAEPRSKVPAYVTGGVAIVAAGVGAVFGIKALGQSSDFKNTPTTKIADDGENNALIADMMFGIAITFGVTSAVLFLSNDAPQAAKAKPSTTTPRVAKKAPTITVTPTPYITPSGGGAGALVRF